MAFDFSRFIPPPGPSWELCQQEARALHTTAALVVELKRRHGIPRHQPLTDSARALLLLELEASKRVAKGQQLERAQALTAITDRASTITAQAIAAAMPTAAQLLEAGHWIGRRLAEGYLSNRVEALTGKHYATAGAACRRAATIAPAAAPAAEPLNGDRFRLAWFWGVILRLDQLEGSPPSDPEAFCAWSQLAAYEGHGCPAPSLSDLFAGRLQEPEARALLQLPSTGPLVPAAVRSAYRSLARTAHPDAGGSRHHFEQLAAARDRLLLIC